MARPDGRARRDRPSLSDATGRPVSRYQFGHPGSPNRGGKATGSWIGPHPADIETSSDQDFRDPERAGSGLRGHAPAVMGSRRERTGSSPAGDALDLEAIPVVAGNAFQAERFFQLLEGDC